MGQWTVFLEQLEQKARTGLGENYKHCADFQASQNKSERISDYLLRSNIGYNCYYIGWRGFTVEPHS